MGSLIGSFKLLAHLTFLFISRHSGCTRPFAVANDRRGYLANSSVSRWNSWRIIWKAYEDWKQRFQDQIAEKIYVGSVSAFLFFSRYDCQGWYEVISWIVIRGTVKSKTERQLKTVSNFFRYHVEISWTKTIWSGHKYVKFTGKSFKLSLEALHVKIAKDGIKKVNTTLFP